ncbi:MAG: GNAT family N-acetyltransferase [Lachnospiraceae bacterium]|nr:GNAT family N-acetyltransferase [Lachnospiraceae bacterium]
MRMKICFCVEGNSQNEAGKALLDRAVRHLYEEGVEAFVLPPEEARPEDHPECLYLADDPQIAGRLRERQGKVVGFLHDKNRQEAFPGLSFVFDDVDEVDADSYRKAWERLSGIPWTILHTDRITVRETTLSDIDDFYRIYRDPSMTEYQEGLFDDPEDEKRYMEDYIRRIYGMFGFGVWTLVNTAENRIIGRAGFSIRRGFDDIELGFMIARPDQGKGYAYEACEAIMRYGQQVLLLPRVQALVKEGNQASVHLCEKLGFERLEEVRIEEDIYGGAYPGEGRVSLSPVRYGNYIRFVKSFTGGH